ncbi:hypothetical protein ZHAS_00017545 [Anopheles sinensis]|uniref:Cu2_monooxygen domain-containing protein n=1 Tax=Anopheles sinensis TaxID=74873 RepID=A0A084WGU6_ANOSI|nr:hypothetical protein ZHAS_00017545 [Anopheles sinensis]
MRVIFMYSDERPQRDSDTLPQPLVAFKGSRSIFLTQRSSQDDLGNEPSVNVLELRNEDVELPEADESLYWCKIFKLDDFVQKHHLVRFLVFTQAKTTTIGCTLAVHSQTKTYPLAVFEVSIGYFRSKFRGRRKRRGEKNK